MNNELNKRVILGIDPGTNVMGYGAVVVVDRHIELVDVGSYRIKSCEVHIDKLQEIYNKVNLLITRLQPSEFAIESPVFGKNVQSMLKLGRAQGVAMAAALNSGMPVVEYSPKKIKKSITGNGNASKEQVFSLLRHFVTMPKENPGLDASDALAVAICHYLQGDQISGQKKFKNWKSFASQNDHRVRK